MRSRNYSVGYRVRTRRRWPKFVAALAVFSLLTGVSVWGAYNTSLGVSARQIVSATFGSGNESTPVSEFQDTLDTKKTVATVDTLKPSVQLNSPTANASLAGDVAVTADANDNEAVSKLEFYVDGSLVGSDEVAPYAYNWATSGETNGRHILMVKAYDGAGNTESVQISTTTTNKPKDSVVPTISLTAPGDGSLVKGKVSLKAIATDTSGIAKVEFYLGTTLLGTDDTRPYMYEWDASKTSGAQKLTARAYDTTGNINTSGITTVLVDAGQSDTVKPTVTLKNSQSSSSVVGTVTVNAEASDNVGIAKVEFYRGNTLLSTDITTPYSYAWDSLSVENADYQLSARAYDAAGNTQNSRSLTLSVKNLPTDKPAPSFDVPNLDGPSVHSKIVVYGDCATNVVGKATPLPSTLASKPAVVGYEFTSSCIGAGKSSTVSVDLGRQVANKAQLKVYKTTTDGVVSDITLSATIDNRKSGGVPHTFVTYTVTDGAVNDQDSAANGVLVDPIFVTEEVQLKPIEETEVKKPIVEQPTVVPQQAESVRFIDTINVREYAPYGIGLAALLGGVIMFALRPRRGYKLLR